MSDDNDCPECVPGLPAWMGTFADLMSLLMCFFVLLLSFAEMEAMKFKQISGSMKEAFGVQREIHAKESPKGTSIIAQEFSPGKPTPTPIKTVQQVTTQDQKPNLDFTDSNTKALEQEGGDPDESASSSEQELAQKKQSEQKTEEELLAEIEAEKKAEEILAELKAALKKEIEQGMVELMNKDNQVVIRVQEKGSFKSGRANIQSTFVPTLDKISRILGKVQGDIIVQGHTDNIPISTKQFPSNWELSAARAATFVHFMKRRGKILAKRLEIRAYADTDPLDAANNAKARSKNRRVEILLLAEADLETGSEKTIDNLNQG